MTNQNNKLKFFEVSGCWPFLYGNIQEGRRSRCSKYLSIFNLE